MDGQRKLAEIFKKAREERKETVPEVFRHPMIPPQKLRAEQAVNQKPSRDHTRKFHKATCDSKRIQKKQFKMRLAHEKDPRNSRTLFIGSLPANTNRKNILKLLIMMAGRTKVKSKHKAAESSTLKNKSGVVKSQVNCGICLQPVIDNSESEDGHDAIFCEGMCQCWLHRGCIGLSKSWFDHFVSTSDKFLCCHCCYDSLCSVIHKVKESIALLAGKLNDFISDLKPLRDKLLSLNLSSLTNDPQDGHVSDIQGPNNHITQSRDTQGPNNHIIQRRDNSPNKYECRFNLIVYGLPECPQGTPKQTRSSDDLQNVVSTLSSIYPTVDDTSVRDCFRLGKYNTDSTNRSRPLLVKLTRSRDVTNILLNRYKLSDHPGIRIKRPDLSRKERLIESILLKERRNLIDTGVDSKSIKLKGNSLFVNNLRFGFVTDSSFHL